MATNDLWRHAPTFTSATNEMLAAILDQGADCIKVISSQGTVDYMNRNGQCAMEIDDPLCSFWAALDVSLARRSVRSDRASNGESADRPTRSI